MRWTEQLINRLVKDSIESHAPVQKVVLVYASQENVVSADSLDVSAGTRN